MTREAASFIECTDDPQHPRFRKGREKGARGRHRCFAMKNRRRLSTCSNKIPSLTRPWNPAPCTKRKERATLKGKGSGQECPLYTTLGGQVASPFGFA